MIKNLLIYLNVFAAIALVLSGLSVYINPESFVLPAFLGLGYPFILIVNIIFIILWFLFFKKKRNALFSLFAIAFTFGSFSSVFNFSAPARSLNDISIMTWNVKNFDLYNWSKNTETHELMMQLLEDKKPDILCLQEFYTETRGNFKNIAELKKRLGYKYYYFGETFSTTKGTKKWGLATFSNFPIKEHGKIPFENKTKLNACIYTDIAYTKDSILRIFNVHLQSLHFGDEDYKYLSELKDEKKADVKGSKKILGKLKTGFQKRAKQAELIKAKAKAFEGKTIICGDFNDTPTSYAYKILADGMKDSFREKGLGFGNTWANPSPFFRIDFILVDPRIKVNTYSTYTKDYSDHYPVQVFLELN